MEAEPVLSSFRDDATEQQERYTPTPIHMNYLGSIALAGSRAYVGSEMNSDWRLESQRISQLTAKLQDMASPYVEAAQKVVPQDTVGKRRLPWQSKQGEYTYVYQSTQNGMNTFTKFTVEYTKDRAFNHADRLRVDTFFNRKPEENRVPDQYVWIEISGDSASSIKFGGRDGGPLSDKYRPDNRIDFTADGVSYDSWLLGIGRTERKYDPISDKFIATDISHEFNLSRSMRKLPQETRTKPMPAVEPQEIIATAQKALALIPVEAEVPLYQTNL